MIKKQFYDWLDYNLKEIPNNVIAINFNLYEGTENTYDVEVIGTEEFSKEDDDWACEGVFLTEDSLFSIPIHNGISDWEEGMSYIKEMIEDYVKISKYYSNLQKLQGLGIGFVDGDIELISLD